MSYQITTKSVSVGNVNFNSSSVDPLMMMHMLMVQDYDSQLSNIASQMKLNSQAKNMYRDVINQYQSYLSRETTTYDKSDLKKDAVWLTPKEQDYASTERSFVPNIGKNTVDERIHINDGSEDADSGNKFNLKPVKEKKLDDGSTVYGVDKEALQKIVDIYTNKLDAINEQSELTSLTVQSITNKRKTAIDTISNLIAKDHEMMSVIINNLK